MGAAASAEAASGPAAAFGEAVGGPAAALAEAVGGPAAALAEAFGGFAAALAETVGGFAAEAAAGSPTLYRAAAAARPLAVRTLPPGKRTLPSLWTKGNMSIQGALPPLAAVGDWAQSMGHVATAGQVGSAVLLDMHTDGRL